MTEIVEQKILNHQKEMEEIRERVARYSKPTSNPNQRTLDYGQDIFRIKNRTPSTIKTRVR